jgi:hypothetical protein
VSKIVPPIHGEDHRPRGWFGPDDPGGPDPIPFREVTAALASLPAGVRRMTAIDTIPSGTPTQIEFSDGEVASGQTDISLATVNALRILTVGCYSFGLDLVWFNEASALADGEKSFAGICTSGGIPNGGGVAVDRNYPSAAPFSTSDPQRYHTERQTHNLRAAQVPADWIAWAYHESGSVEEIQATFWVVKLGTISGFVPF